eukprot:JP440967.1.p1 GENE.JP440967.1~~JP440967.1.p1  ORF type:complete len:70 (-),score=0.97 JP440967.1:1-210(-)
MCAASAGSAIAQFTSKFTAHLHMCMLQAENICALSVTHELSASKVPESTQHTDSCRGLRHTTMASACCA